MVPVSELRARRSVDPLPAAERSSAQHPQPQDGSQIAYLHHTSIDVVDIATGKTTTITQGSQYDWYDDHTLIYSIN
ncbi:MAG TPA: hypothetical protein VFJ66_02915 [Gaiellales bacterium]|nr:hypothetical protein [Gaiellales bacterium]